jgi:Protein of unknown function (DUF4058)
VPLQLKETEPIVPLQRLVNEIYTRARFDLAIDYMQPLKPTLTHEEAAWIDAIVQM